MGDRPARECEEYAERILVVSKSATASEEEIAAQIEAASALARWDEIVVTSALEGQNVETFVDAVVNYLPEGPLWFPADMETDQPQEVIVAEFIREKMLFTVYDEVPHAIGVVVEEMGYNRRKHLTRIYATIYVERDSQKGHPRGQRWRYHQAHRHRSAQGSSKCCWVPRSISTCRSK